MDKLRKYIRKEIQSLHEQKSYPVPLELLDVMKDTLQMRPLKRYINNIKAVNSIPPSYKIFLHNAQSFDIIYAGDQENNFRVRIAGKEYDLLAREEKPLAINALNRLLTAPLPPNFGDEDEKETPDTTSGTTGGGTTTGFGGGGNEEETGTDTATEPDEGGDEEIEPDPDMI